MGAEHQPVLPKTPEKSRPFQNPPTTANRNAHLAYLNRRMEDHFNADNDDELYPLSPTFWSSWKAYQSTTETKILKAKLITEREHAREQVALQAARNKADKDGKKYVQKSGVLHKGSGAWQVAHRRETLLEKEELDNNIYLNRRVKETDAFIRKHITGTLPRRRRLPSERAPYDLGFQGESGPQPPFIDYGYTGLKKHHAELREKWSEQRPSRVVEGEFDRWHIGHSQAQNQELFYSYQSEFRQEGGWRSNGAENGDIWVKEWGEFHVREWARECGFIDPPRGHPSFYNDGFGNIVRLDTDGTETIIGYTKQGVVGD